MTGRLDRYVGKTVWGSYGAALLFMLLLSVLVDVLVQLGDYIRGAQERGIGSGELAWLLLRYYTALFPVLFVATAPFVTVIAAMFAVSRLMGANEVVPMIFTGRSVFRVLRPIFFTALFSIVGMAASWEFVVPQVAETLQRVRSLIEGGDAVATVKNVVIDRRADGKGLLLSWRYVHDEQRLEELVYLVEGAVPADSYKISAASAVWNPELGDWELVDGRRRTASVMESGIEQLGLPEVTPDAVWQSGKESKTSTELSYSDLSQLRELRPDRKSYTLGFHTHLTFPLANLVLLFLALPFAVSFERGGKVVRVVFSILVCGLYLVADLTCQGLVGTGLHPIFAAWLPPILFGSLGTVFFAGIRT